jgi:hypothetical protein
MTWYPRGLLFIAILIMAACSQRPETKRFTTWDFEHMHEVKRSVRRGFSPYRAPYRELIEVADKAMTRGSYSVTGKTIIPEGGTKNDYLSFGPWWWPDPLSEDGLPYVRNEHATNPEGSYNRIQLNAMVEDVRSLTLAWYFSGEKLYAAKAADHLRSWFLDPETFMTPHLEFAQAIPGRTGGRATGIIEAHALISLLDAIVLAEASGALRKYEEKQIRQWFSEYLLWLTSSVQGREMTGFYNRHALARDVQIVCVSHFLGSDEFVIQKLITDLVQRIGKMIGPDGRQPEELKYGYAFSSSVSNLGDFLTVAELCRNVNSEEINQITDGEGSIRQALEFLLTFAGNDNSWQWGREGVWHDDENALGLLVRRAGRYFNDPEYQIVWDQAFKKRLGNHWSLLVKPGLSGN